jgi:hypothetical protein
MEPQYVTFRVGTEFIIWSRWTSGFKRLSNHHSTMFLDPNLMTALLLPPRSSYSRLGNEEVNVSRGLQWNCVHSSFMNICVLFSTVSMPVVTSTGPAGDKIRRQLDTRKPLGTFPNREQNSFGTIKVYAFPLLYVYWKVNVKQKGSPYIDYANEVGNFIFNSSCACWNTFPLPVFRVP